jgi:hypothetical protein
MAFKIRVRQAGLGLGAKATAQPQTKTVAPESSTWQIQLSTDAEESQIITLSDPFDGLDSAGDDPEKTLKWYLEDFIHEPFETTQGDLAAATLTEYGRGLATQLAQSGLLPSNGDIELEIGSVSRHTHPRTIGNRDLQQLHWEVLEDVGVWPDRYNFASVSVVRLVHQGSDTTGTSSRSDSHELAEERTFNILLVVCRPGQGADLHYQLVSRYLVAIVEHVSKASTNVKATLTVLRPPTWNAFRTHLKDRKGKYDLVHMDMHGKIMDDSKGSNT